jgi:uncharacterized protein (TIGR03118 family)
VNQNRSLQVGRRDGICQDRIRAHLLLNKLRAGGNWILQAQQISPANLAANKIEVFGAKFAPATLSGNFTDPSIPSGFAPFNVHVMNNQVFVMYAQQNPAGGPPTTGSGAGYVSVFDSNGNFVARAISLKSMFMGGGTLSLLF